MKYIFHGTNAKLLDAGLIAGTYFTDDLDIAIKYGNTIYGLCSDAWSIVSRNEEGHYVSHGFIPLEYLIKLEVSN